MAVDFAESVLAMARDNVQRSSLGDRITLPSSTHLQRLIHGFNHFWFKYVRMAPLALGNILVLRRHV